MSDPRPNVATGIDWVFAPDWLTIEQACFLSSHDRGAMLGIICEHPELVEGCDFAKPASFDRLRMLIVLHRTITILEPLEIVQPFLACRALQSLHR
jgi:hypothetical protein